MADQNKNHPSNSAGVRRVKYGSNIALLLVIAIVLVSMLAWLTYVNNKKYDWTTGGLYTLSPQTKNLLKEVSEQKQPYEIFNNFQPDSAAGQQVQDMLDQYVQVANNIKLIDPKDRVDMDSKIRERYTGETKPYKETLAAFEPLADKLVQFFKDQGDGLLAQAGSTKNLSAEDAREAQGIANAFGKEIPAQLQKARQIVRKFHDATSPEWSRAKTQVSSILTATSEQLKQIASASPDNFGKFTQEYLKKAGPAYGAMLKDVDAYKTSVDNLPPLKIDDVMEAVGPDTLIVVGPATVKVIPAGDIFKQDTANPDAAHPKVLFQGEQSLSTALMAMVRPNKPKIVFVSMAPAQLLGGPFSEINDRLTKVNFEVSEWSPPGMPNPEQPQPPSTPPAMGKDASGKPVVWVVLPSDPPNQQQMQMGMPPPDPRPLIEAVKKHMEAGGNVLFLTEGASPMTAMMGGAGGFPYADLIKPYGIQVKDTYNVLRSVHVSDEDIRAVPQIEFSTFPSHPITDPLQSLTTLFVGSPSQMGIMGAPTVVDIIKPAPAGSDPAVIVQTPASAEIFATSNTMTPNPVFDPKTDLKAPVPMGAASSLNGQRIVVIGNRIFLVSQLLQEQAMDMQSGRILYRFPGNAELFINSVSWLSGYENMIAVSPQANIAQRIKSMGDPDKGELPIRLGGFILPPLLAVAIGAIIYVVRRRA